MTTFLGLFTTIGGAPLMQGRSFPGFWVFMTIPILFFTAIAIDWNAHKSLAKLATRSTQMKSLSAVLLYLSVLTLICENIEKQGTVWEFPLALAIAAVASASMGVKYSKSRGLEIKETRQT